VLLLVVGANILEEWKDPSSACVQVFFVVNFLECSNRQSKQASSFCRCCLSLAKKSSNPASSWIIVLWSRLAVGVATTPYYRTAVLIFPRNCDLQTKTSWQKNKAGFRSLIGAMTSYSSWRQNFGRVILWLKWLTSSSSSACDSETCDRSITGATFVFWHNNQPVLTLSSAELLEYLMSPCRL